MKTAIAAKTAIAVALALLILASPRLLADETNTTEESASPASDKAEELAKETQNPVAKLISVPFQNNFNFNLGPNHVTQYILNVR